MNYKILLQFLLIIGEIILTLLVFKSKAQEPILNKQNHIIKHKYYWINMNDSLNQPNYVFYKIYKSNLIKPKLKRVNIFKLDPSNLTISSIFYHNSCKYDRGHLFNFENNAWDLIAIKECFYMTNICPQDPKLNRGVWKSIEEYERKLTLQYDSIYSTTGVIFEGYKCSGLNIPTYFYKILFYYVGDGIWQSQCFLCLNQKPISKKALDYSVQLDEILIKTEEILKY